MWLRRAGRGQKGIGQRVGINTVGGPLLSSPKGYVQAGRLRSATLEVRSKFPGDAVLRFKGMSDEDRGLSK